MYFAPMVDMAKTPEEVKKEAPAPLADMPPRVPVYPWGLSISLDEGCLAKLGIDGDMPSVGEMIHLCAMAKVTSVSENEMESDNGGKKTCRRVELQITHLATENEDDENAAVERQIQSAKERRKRFYDSDEG